MTDTSPDQPTADQTWANRIQALLTKAESTAAEFPEEAEALLAKAQELMVRHAIDEATLSAAGRAASDRVVSDVIVVAAPYATAKASLLGSVGRANDCRVVMGRAGDGAQRCVVVGHESDLANVRSLFSALSLHAVRSMLAAPVPPYDTPRRFRHAFLLAFAGRIGERLWEAGETVRRQARADASTGAGVAVVLADRSAAVDRAFRETFPRVRNTTLSSSSL
ncbi:MAG TPA: DUF2786 domain-containing protein, partial [Aquihabitans sp.]|nr:DUF2786 domain-containing protein [Aquihabitans sp.]